MIENSNRENPVTFPPGCARLLTKPVSTGSPLPGKTIGIEAVIFIRTGIARPTHMRISGLEAKIFAA
jgi:hypothetical protein